MKYALHFQCHAASKISGIQTQFHVWCTQNKHNKDKSKINIRTFCERKKKRMHEETRIDENIHKYFAINAMNQYYK